MLEESVTDNVTLEFGLQGDGTTCPDVLDSVCVLTVVTILGVLVRVFAIRVKDNLSHAERILSPAKTEDRLKDNLRSVRLPGSGHSEKSGFCPSKSVGVRLTGTAEVC